MGKETGTYVSETRSSVSEPAIDLSHIQYAYIVNNCFNCFLYIHECMNKINRVLKSLNGYTFTFISIIYILPICMNFNLENIKSLFP